jgi:hypothetical protein
VATQVTVCANSRNRPLPSNHLIRPPSRLRRSPSSRRDRGWCTAWSGGLEGHAPMELTVGMARQLLSAAEMKLRMPRIANRPAAIVPLEGINGLPLFGHTDLIRALTDGVESPACGAGVARCNIGACATQWRARLPDDINDWQMPPQASPFGSAATSTQRSFEPRISQITKIY